MGKPKPGSTGLKVDAKLVLKQGNREYVLTDDPPTPDFANHLIQEMFASTATAVVRPVNLVSLVDVTDVELCTDNAPTVSYTDNVLTVNATCTPTSAKTPGAIKIGNFDANTGKVYYFRTSVPSGVTITPDLPVSIYYQATFNITQTNASGTLANAQFKSLGLGRGIAMVLASRPAGFTLTLGNIVYYDDAYNPVLTVALNKDVTNARAYIPPTRMPADARLVEIVVYNAGTERLLVWDFVPVTVTSNDYVSFSFSFSVATG